MEIIAQKLSDFIESISLKGKINTCVLNFKEEGLSCMVMSLDNIFFASGELNKSNFDNYEAIGEVGIRDCNILNNLLKECDENPVKLKVQENKLVIVTPDGPLKYNICDKKNVNTHREESPVPEGSFKETFELDVEKLIKIKKVSGTISADAVVVQIKDKKLSFFAENAVGDEVIVETKIDYPNASSKFGSYLFSIIDVIGGTILISFSDNKPICIKCGSFQYVVAPLVEQTED